LLSIKKEFAMKVLFTIFALLLMAPVVLLVSIAMGPAALVILFIVGIALVMAGPVWLVDRARSYNARRTPVPPLDT
jgi:predicted MFS family arabinose efflux permease